MKVRLLTALGMAVFGIPVLIFSKYLVYPIVLSLLCLIATFEIMRALGVHKNYGITIPAYLMALAGPTLAYFIRGKHLNIFLLSIAGVMFLYLIYLFFFAVFMKGKLKFERTAEVFATAFYVIASFTALSVVRYMSAGIWCLVMLLIAAWGSDSFAYFTGMLFGKHKLIPEISPKKTIEGSIGGIISATLLMLLYGFIVQKTTDYTPNYIVLAVCGLVFSAVSQIGDLVASLIKREQGIKDYGKILPGHGGIMDRFDSVLSITTALMMVCIVFPPFV